MSRKIKRLVSRTPRPSPPEFDPGPAWSLLRQGRLAAAAAICGQALVVNPRQAEALNLLATVRQQQGQFQEAVRLLNTAIGLSPDRADYLCNLGSAHRGLGEPGPALAAFRKALALSPGQLEAQFNLALTLLDLDDRDQAAQVLTRLLSARPAFVPARQLLARIRSVQGRTDEAVAELIEIIRLEPENSAAHCELGNLMQAQGRLAEAASAYERAIASRPDYAVAINNLGNTLVKQGLIHQALHRYQEALRHDPDLVEAHVNLSWAYKAHGMLKEDVAAMRGYLARHPEDAKAHSDLLFSLNYDPDYSPAELLAAAQDWWRRHQPSTPPLAAQVRAAGGGLRIGFLSPDFRKHPVGTFLLPLFEALSSHPEVSLRCYAELAEGEQDEISRRLRGVAGGWFSTLGLDAEAGARLVREDRPDLLIDLAGHSANNRLGIMALRPAPVQASWLGYVNTTGLPVIDYRLTDAVADPVGSEGHYSEKLIRLPGPFFCYAPPAEAAEVGPLPARQQGVLTFASLNNPAKITEEVIALWAELLRRVPGSRLLLVGSQFRDPEIAGLYRARFVKQGVEAGRISVIPARPWREYFQLHNQIDIALDPFPHNGHTVTCHALWMGVPVITLAGDRYAARLGASVLAAAGLNRYVARDQAEYLDLAAALAGDLSGLAELRRRLRPRLKAAPICDVKGFAEGFLRTVAELLAPVPGTGRSATGAVGDGQAAGDEG